jgi:probable rRNA maturation factor
MISIQNTTKDSALLDKEELKAAVLHTLTAMGQTDTELTLRITSDEEIQELNREYRGVDKPTDVLSFNQDVVDPETGHLYLGDIIISLETARRQALEQGHSLSKECLLLAIHGTLHLLGYDHAEPNEKEEMWRIQDRLLAELDDKNEQERQ